MVDQFSESHILCYPLIAADVTASDHNDSSSSAARVMKGLIASHDIQSKTISYAGHMAESFRTSRTGVHL